MFLDLNKAYEKANKMIYEVLYKSGSEDWLLNAIRVIYNGNKAQGRINIMYNK